MVLTKGKLGAFGSQATRLGSGTLLLLLMLLQYRDWDWNLVEI